MIGISVRSLFYALFAVVSLLAIGVPQDAVARDRELFITSAIEHGDNTVTFPLYRGTRGGLDVWFIVLDSSDGNDAKARGVNRSQKLNNARGTPAVQNVSVTNGVIEFPASVDFSPMRVVVAGPQGFPPSTAEPGARGEVGYSPLIQLPNGIIINAPQIANVTGEADKVVSIDYANRTVRFQQTLGFQGGRAVKYVSTDASDKGVAALEGVTYAPALATAPFAGGDGTDSSRASLVAFVNGQTRADNPQRQGLNSALLDRLDPLNVLSWNPKQGRYSPLWDVFPTQWSAQAVASGGNLRQTDLGQIENLANDGTVTGPDGARWGAANIVVNCPIVSRD